MVSSSISVCLTFFFYLILAGILSEWSYCSKCNEQVTEIHSHSVMDDSLWSSRNTESQETEDIHHHGAFSFRRSLGLFKTKAGELRVIVLNNEHIDHMLGLGFLSLEPKGLLLPHYIDGDSLFMMHKGKGRFSWINMHNDELHEMDVVEGDVYKIDGGSVFQFSNIDESERLYIFSIHDIEEYNGLIENNQTIFHNFFVTARDKLHSVLSGFGEDVLSTVFNVSSDKVQKMLRPQTDFGPIVFSSEMNESNYGFQDISRSENGGHLHQAYNILNKEPDFTNNYGSTAVANAHDFKMLRDLNKGLFSVKLKPGAVLAPHWNPVATEIGLVTKGIGEIRIVYPNGSKALCETLTQGMVFYVPRNFPMCHISSRSHPFEFVGFSTSSSPNHPQFLAGSNSLLHKWNNVGSLLAKSFNMTVKHFQGILDSQTEAVIFPRLHIPEV